MPESISLQVNQLAPEFELTDIFDRVVNLKDYRGKKLLIAFFRHAGCPFCNVRVHNLQTHHEKLKALGLEMVFFFESEKQELRSHKFHNSISPIPLIADPEKVWYNAYGIENSALKSVVSHITSLLSSTIRAKIKRLPVHMMAGKESINTMPAEFLVDEKGVVKLVHYARHLNDRMRSEQIYKFAEGSI